MRGFMIGVAHVYETEVADVSEVGVNVHYVREESYTQGDLRFEEDWTVYMEFPIRCHCTEMLGTPFGIHLVAILVISIW